MSNGAVSCSTNRVSEFLRKTAPRYQSQVYGVSMDLKLAGFVSIRLKYGWVAFCIHETDKPALLAAGENQTSSKMVSRRRRKNEEKSGSGIYIFSGTGLL